MCSGVRPCYKKQRPVHNKQCFEDRPHTFKHFSSQIPRLLETSGLSLPCRRSRSFSGKIRSGVGLGRGTPPPPPPKVFLALVLLPNEFWLKRTNRPSVTHLGPGSDGCIFVEQEFHNTVMAITSATVQRGEAILDTNNTTSPHYFSLILLHQMN